MASTSTNKKGIADFLWDWAKSNGDWGKLLVDKIFSTEEPLAVNEREDIFNYFLQSVNLASGLPNVRILKPTFTPTTKDIKLTSLSEIRGVNCLAKNQTLSFGTNITVIYGENGSGKTGYSRILKSLGFSYDPDSDILSNVHSSKGSKHAIIRFFRR